MIFFTRNKTSNLNRDYIEEDTFQVISSWKERKIRRIYLRIGIGFRKIPAGGKKAEENWFAEHGDNDRKSIVFRERSATKLWAASARPAPRKKKKNRGKWLCGTREKGNVQGAAFDKPYLLEGNTVGKIVA